ncbi:MAG: HD domain-containing phosphohydrolase [Sphingopyxis sp.]|nr:HD domain-containing phosphohydrolase [Sphingopyxis sp.]
MFQRHGDQFTPASGGTGDSALAGILGAFSYALDMTEGQPAGHSIRACWIGTALASHIGITGAALSDIYYAVLLKDLGCSANAARVAQLFVGDDRQLKHNFKLIGPKPEDFGGFIMTEVGVGAIDDIRSSAIDHLLANAPTEMTDIMATRCTRGADIARQLRFSEDVAAAIAHLDEHWDGSGLPLGIAGEAIHMGGRIALLAQIADVFFTAYGPEEARTEIAARSGSWLDPALADAFLALSAEPAFWASLAAPDLESRLFDLPPARVDRPVDAVYLDDIVSAFGQVIDAKSPYTGGHSERVGMIADAVAAEIGLSATARLRLRQAAMLHDIGKLGVSSHILEKPGRLDEQEWAVMQSHAAETGAILSRVAAMADMAMVAAAHHERLDGKGYPLGLDARSIGLETRIISVADFFDALTADRPYRAAMPVDAALGIMRSEVGGALDAACFAALERALAAGKLDFAPAPAPAMPQRLVG